MQNPDRENQDNQSPETPQLRLEARWTKLELDLPGLAHLKPWPVEQLAAYLFAALRDFAKEIRAFVLPQITDQRLFIDLAEALAIAESHASSPQGSRLRLPSPCLASQRDHDLLEAFILAAHALYWNRALLLAFLEDRAWSPDWELLLLEALVIAESALHADGAVTEKHQNSESTALEKLAAAKRVEAIRLRECAPARAAFNEIELAEARREQAEQGRAA